MTDRKSWKKRLQSHTEVATETVRRCVTAMRAAGHKTDPALRDLAGILATSPRRVRTLFHRDGDPVVLHHEWANLRFRAGLFFLNEAARLRRLADEYETQGEALVSGQLEFSWETSCADKNSERQPVAHLPGYLSVSANG